VCCALKNEATTKRQKKKSESLHVNVHFTLRFHASNGTKVPTYSQGRRTYRTVLKDASPENFHEWRKRVKQIWYHVRLLQPIWPEQMDAGGDELKLLGEQLGDDHDLFLLEQSAEKQCAQNGNVKESETLRGLITQRQGELRDAALKLGARFYAEKPSMFAARLGSYWQLWRNGRRKRAS